MRILFLLQYRTDEALAKLNLWLNAKMFLPFNTLKILQNRLGEQAFVFHSQVLNLVNGGVDYYNSIIDLIVSNYSISQYREQMWALVGSKSKHLHELVANVLVKNDADAEARAIDLLQDKNAGARQTAALILAGLSTPMAKEAILKVLHTETNDSARDVLLEAVAGLLPIEPDMDFVNTMIISAAKRDKLAKPIEPWLDEALLPALYFYDHSIVPSDAIRFLLHRMSRVKAMRSDVEARYIIQKLDKEKSAPFALSLIKIYIEKGAKPEYKYLMALAALIGDDMVVDKIRITINHWIDENRYKMAEYGVGALALQGSDKALRWVEWYSRKYKSKKANVGAAALVALEAAAEELNITIHELGDRIVPDFGFDGLFKHFTIAGEDYRAFIDSNFKIAFFNDDNKKLKSLPAAADAILKDEFKHIGKEIRDIVKSQSSRLEYYLIIQRRWTPDQWKTFFLQNPVMFIYATKLLWGVYDTNGNVTQTFICNDDTSLLNIENDEISIEEVRGQIGIIHPVQLNDELLNKWKRQFFDLNIETIFLQLERKMIDAKKEDLEKTIITRYAGRKTVQGSIRSTLERSGWHKGQTGDGGYLESFNLLYFERRIEAVLEIEGVGVGYGWGGEEKLGRLFIIDKSKITQKWFNAPQNGSDERLVKFKDIPPIFLSEILSAIESIKEQQ